MILILWRESVTTARILFHAFLTLGWVSDAGYPLSLIRDIKHGVKQRGESGLAPNLVLDGRLSGRLLGLSLSERCAVNYLHFEGIDLL